MNKSIKRVWNILTSIVVAVVVVLAILLAGIRLIGLQVFTVLSGSMEPAYHTGSLIYVKDIEDKTAIEAGTVITFMMDEDTIATHRVVAAVPDEEDPSVVRYRTKGDANEAEDGALVHYKNVIGTPVFTIPKMGYFANYIQHPPGSYVTLSVGAFLMLLMFMPELVSAIKGDDKFESQKQKKNKHAKEKPQKQGEKAAGIVENRTKLPHKGAHTASGAAHTVSRKDKKKMGRHEA